VEQRARHRGLADPALVRAYDDDRWLCHGCPLESLGPFRLIHGFFAELASANIHDMHMILPLTGSGCAQIHRPPMTVDNLALIAAVRTPGAVVAARRRRAADLDGRFFRQERLTALGRQRRGFVT